MKTIRRLFLLLLPLPAFATGVGGGLPWERPIILIWQSLSGPVAMGVGIVAFVMAGSTLAFGRDFNEFARHALLVTLAVSFLVLSSGFVSTLFGVAGAVIR